MALHFSRPPWSPGDPTTPPLLSQRERGSGGEGARAVIEWLERDFRQLLSFGVIGVACTVMYAVLYAVLRGRFGPLTSNVVALIPTMAVNFWANRSLTFRSASGSLPRQAGLYLVAYLVGLGASTGIFAVLLDLLNPRSILLETGAGIVSGLAATLVRYILMSRWVFAPPRPTPPTLERQTKTS